MSTTAPRRRGFLDTVEWIGNKLPEPTVLFVWCALTVMVASHLAVALDWQVQPVRPERIESPGAEPSVRLVEFGEPIRAKSLLTSDGIYWCLKTMVKSFIEFKPLGIVLVAMLGVGVAERSGLIAAALKAMMLVVPRRLLTPAVILVGVLSSISADSGYVVLPALAAALYKSVGRSPLAGAAAVYAGIAGGFSANLAITSLDPLLSSLTQEGARVLDAAYEVNPACNWWFMIGSTFLITLVGWAVSAKVVERRLARIPAADGGPGAATDAELAEQRLGPPQWRALSWAAAAALAGTAAVIALALIPGAPLHGSDEPASKSARWIVTIVPLLFVLFLLPGIVYGVAIRTIRSARDVSTLMVESMASMAPVLVLYFFAAQFIAYLGESNINKMLAYSVGKELAAAGLPTTPLLIAFALLVMFLNLFIGSASAKWSAMATIFVPIFMLLGISPELTQAAYRVGDSTTNMITPLNPYFIIFLVVARKYAPRAGPGTLISLTLPYCLVIAAAWLAMLFVWIMLGRELGPDGGLWYSPAV